MVDGIRKRLSFALETTELSRAEIADHLGINRSWLYDLEAYDDEASSTLTLRQCSDLASLLGLSPRYLVCGERSAANTPLLSPAELVEAIHAHAASQGLTIESFGDVVGWDVQAVMSEPELMWSAWNLDCLRDVCGRLNLDWCTLFSTESGKVDAI